MKKLLLSFMIMGTLTLSGCCGGGGGCGGYDVCNSGCGCSSCWY